MLKALHIAVSLAVFTLTAQAAEQPAAQFDRRSCDLMSREEMQLCLNTKEGDVSGARSVRCDQLSRSTIEACLQPGDANAAASSSAPARPGASAAGDPASPSGGSQSATAASTEAVASGASRQ
jgi:hypothetical protein